MVWLRLGGGGREEGVMWGVTERGSQGSIQQASSTTVFSLSSGNKLRCQMFFEEENKQKIYKTMACAACVNEFADYWWRDCTHIVRHRLFWSTIAVLTLTDLELPVRFTGASDCFTNFHIFLLAELFIYIYYFMHPVKLLHFERWPQCFQRWFLQNVPLSWYSYRTSCVRNMTPVRTQVVL